MAPAVTGWSVCMLCVLIFVGLDELGEFLGVGGCCGTRSGWLLFLLDTAVGLSGAGYLPIRTMMLLGIYLESLAKSRRPKTLSLWSTLLSFQ